MHNVVQHLKTYQATIDTGVHSEKDIGLCSRTKKWMKMHQTQIKFNWDATIKVVTKCTGFGGLARGSAGEVLASFCSSYLSTLPPEIAEAMALRKIMLRCRDLDFSNMLFERDCL